MSEAPTDYWPLPWRIDADEIYVNIKDADGFLIATVHHDNEEMAQRIIDAVTRDADHRRGGNKQ